MFKLGISQLLFHSGDKFLFSSEVSTDFLDEAKKIGMVRVNKNVKEDLVIQASTMLMLTTSEILRKYATVSSEQVESANKLFNLMLTLMIAAYRDEIDLRNNAIFKSLGISGKLLERLISLGKKAEVA